MKLKITTEITKYLLTLALLLGATHLFSIPIEVEVSADLWGHLSPDYLSNENKFVENLFKAGWQVEEKAEYHNEVTTNLEEKKVLFKSFNEWKSAGEREVRSKRFFIRKSFETKKGFDLSLGNLEFKLNNKGRVVILADHGQEVLHQTSLPVDSNGVVSKFSGSVFVESSSGERQGASPYGYLLVAEIKGN